MGQGESKVRHILVVDNTLNNASKHLFYFQLRIKYTNYRVELNFCAYTAVEVKSASFGKYKVFHILVKAIAL